MRELLCHRDSYLKEFEAKVVEVKADERSVALDRTAFFPGGGGQPCDRGWLNGLRVLRNRLMRTHTAFHILCGVVWRDWKAQVTGGTMEPLKGRMDFEFETLNHELVAEIEKRINAEVAANRRDLRSGPAGRRRDACRQHA